MDKMVWNVYVENFNRKCIEPYNILNHSSFSADIEKAYKKHKDDFDAFSEAVKRSLMYYYWSKAEWEIILGPWCGAKSGKDMEIKVDVYDQVMLNWETFIKYVWEQAHKRKTSKKRSKDEKES